MRLQALALAAALFATPLPAADDAAQRKDLAVSAEGRVVVHQQGA